MKPKKRLEKLEEFLLKKAKKSLSESNFKDGTCVQVINKLDGSVFFYDSALAMLEDGYWYIIPEHHSSEFHWYDDVEVRCYKRISASSAEGPLKDVKKT